MNIKDDTIKYFLKIITLVFAVLLLFNIVNAIGYFVSERRNAHPNEIKVKVDTLFVYDTIFVEKPVIKKVEIEVKVATKPKRWGIEIPENVKFQLKIGRIM